MPLQPACHAHNAAQSLVNSEKFMYSPLRMIPRVAAAVVLSLGATCALAQTPPAADHATASSAADNTGINKRDRADATVKPTDQPNNAADIKVAAAVRRAITSEGSLSMMAHNVKLVASAGVVTLRGPVANAAEKARVEQLASAAPGVSSVRNELDIKQ
jgi:osmotically-inducible protein OsmY